MKMSITTTLVVDSKLTDDTGPKRRDLRGRQVRHKTRKDDFVKSCFCSGWLEAGCALDFVVECGARIQPRCMNGGTALSTTMSHLDRAFTFVMESGVCLLLSLTRY